MRSETMYVFLTTSRSFYVKGLIPENGRNGLNSAKNVLLRRAPMTTQTPAKSSLTSPKRILVSPAFQQDQDRLNRSSGSPEIAKSSSGSLFPTRLTFFSPAPPWATGGSPD